MLSSKVLLLLHACAAAATPVQSVNVCAVQSAVLNGLKQYSAAASFCSTFLGIKTSTVTVGATATPSPIVLTTPVTVTAGQVSTTSTVSETITVTSPNSVLITPTETATSTTTLTDVVSCVATATILNLGGAAPPVNKRTAPKTTSTRTSSSTKAVSTTKKSSTSVTPTSSKPPSTSCTIPPALSSFASSVLSTGCSCLSLPTPSVTSTSTVTLAPATVTTPVTVTVTPTTTILTTETETLTESPFVTATVAATTTTITATATATSVVPTGLKYYYWFKQYNYRFERFNRVPSIVNSLSGANDYSYSSTVQNINSIRASKFEALTLPNSGGQQVQNYDFAFIFQGYLFAAGGAGTYTLSAPAYTNDDNGAIWVGPAKAYGTGWRWENADVQNLFDIGGSVSVQLAAGELYPIVIYYSNADPPAAAGFRIGTPDGVSHDDTSPYFVGGCEGGSALFVP